MSAEREGNSLVTQLHILEGADGIEMSACDSHSHCVNVVIKVQLVVVYLCMARRLTLIIFMLMIIIAYQCLLLGENIKHF